MTRDAVAAGELTLTRVYAAPREAVWRAWTEPEQIAAWWGKRGWRTPPESVTLDVRPGGAFRLTSISDADGTEMRHDGVYREVLEPERLVFAELREGGAVGTVTLTDLGDGRTEMTFHTTMRTTAAIREAARGGLTSAFDRLAELLDHPHDPGATA
jgi:uncharacterized protein YndB with AHSA1/START domain